MSRNLIARIAVAVVAVPAILWISYRGGVWLFGMVMLFALLAAGEFLTREGFRPSGLIFWLGLVAIGLSIGVSTGFVDLSRLLTVEMSIYGGVLAVLSAFFLITAMILVVGKESPAELFKRHARLMWGVLYLGLLYPFVYKVGQGLPTIGGGDCLLFLFALLWLGDTAAMGVGKWLGKHKLAPTVSPNKTVEGFVGGIVGALVIAVVMHFWRLPDLGLVHLVFIALGASVFGQLGDLVESMWKRSLGIKDSSSLIPGHGGLLDRFDSLLFAAPFVYAYLHLVVR
jgi:phosphatidate cytidylyltransferase